MVLNITKIPISSTKLNFQPTSSQSGSSQFGGFSSQQAQTQALQRAIAESQRRNPEEFVDKKTGKEYAYVSKVMSPSYKPPTQQRTQQIQAKPISIIPKVQNIKTPARITKSTQFTQTRSSSVGKPAPTNVGLEGQYFGANQSGQTYNQYSGNVPGQIQDTVLANVAEVGQGTRNIGEDYVNLPGQLLGSGYEDKSLINRSIEQVFEGDFDEAGRIITSNPQQLAGELLVEIPLTILPVGPVTRGIKAAGQGLKAAAKYLLATPAVIKKGSPAEKKVVEKILDKPVKDVTKKEQKALENWVKKEDRKLAKNIKPSRYDNRITKDIKAKAHEKLIKDDTADWAKAPKGIATDPKSIGYVKPLKSNVFNKPKPPVDANQQVVGVLKAVVNDSKSSKAQKLNAKRILEQMAKEGLASRGSTFDNAKALKGVGVGAASIGGILGVNEVANSNAQFGGFSVLPSIPEAEAFPVGAVVKGAAKLVKSVDQPIAKQTTKQADQAKQIQQAQSFDEIRRRRKLGQSRYTGQQFTYGGAIAGAAGALSQFGQIPEAEAFPGVGPIAKHVGSEALDFGKLLFNTGKGMEVSEHYAAQAGKQAVKEQQEVFGQMSKTVGRAPGQIKKPSKYRKQEFYDKVRDNPKVDQKTGVHIAGSPGNPNQIISYDDLLKYSNKNYNKIGKTQTTLDYGNIGVGSTEFKGAKESIQHKVIAKARGIKEKIKPSNISTNIILDNPEKHGAGSALRIAGWAHRGKPQNIYLNRLINPAGATEKQITDTIIHESHHNVLDKMGMEYASYAMDNLVYRSPGAIRKIKKTVGINKRFLDAGNQGLGGSELKNIPREEWTKVYKNIEAEGKLIKNQKTRKQKVGVASIATGVAGAGAVLLSDNGKWSVTTGDKVRVFKNKATAEKYYKRIHGSAPIYPSLGESIGASLTGLGTSLGSLIPSIPQAEALPFATILKSGAKVITKKTGGRLGDDVGYSPAEQQMKTKYAKAGIEVVYKPKATKPIKKSTRPSKATAWRKPRKISVGVEKVGPQRPVGNPTKKKQIDYGLLSDKSPNEVSNILMNRNFGQEVREFPPGLMLASGLARTGTNVSKGGVNRAVATHWRTRAKAEDAKLLKQKIDVLGSVSPQAKIQGGIQVTRSTKPTKLANQRLAIKQAINSELNKGITNKQDIYTNVVNKLGVPRATVRRVAGELKTDYSKKATLGGGLAGIGAGISSFIPGIPEAQAVPYSRNVKTGKQSNPLDILSGVYAGLQQPPTPSGVTVTVTKTKVKVGNRTFKSQASADRYIKMMNQKVKKQGATATIIKKGQRNLAQEQAAVTAAKTLKLKPIKSNASKTKLTSVQKLAQAKKIQAQTKKENELQRLKYKSNLKPGTDYSRAGFAKNQQSINSSYRVATPTGYITNPYEMYGGYANLNRKPKGKKFSISLNE